MNQYRMRVISLALSSAAMPLVAQAAPSADSSTPSAEASAPAQSATAAPTPTVGETIVVVGTRSAVKAIRSSNAVSLFNEATLKKLAPSSVGELVRSIPGFHAEDSGGEVGNNIAPRGFPLSTQTQFTALQRDGLTVFYDQDILFSQEDRFTRVSNFISSAQAVRGGSSSVFVGSAPAGYINFVSREGRYGQKTEGDIQLETNNNSRIGVDAWTTFALGDRTAVAVGGWYRADNSGRDPGFTANRGGEFNANIKHQFADGKGSIKLEFNLQDDRAIFYLPQPLTGSTANPRTIPGGPSISNGTTGASAFGRFIHLPGTPLGDVNLDLADGQQDKTTYFGGKLNYELGHGWAVTDQARFTNLHTPFNAIINVGNARSLTTIAQEIYNRNPTRFAGALNGGTLDFQVLDAGTGEVLANQNTADALNTNGYGIDAGYFYRNVKATNFQNQLELQNSKAPIGPGVLSSTFGLFTSIVDGQVLDLRLDTLQDISPRPHRLDIVFTNGGGTALATGAGTYKGLLAGPTGFANAQFNERTIAPYVDLVYDVGKLSLNAGARYETLHVTGGVENVSNYDLSTNAQTYDPGNPALTSLPFGNGSFRNLDLQFNRLAWTVGGNYEVRSNLALFARFAHGFRMPDVDQYQSLATFDASTADGQAAIRNFNDRPEVKPITTTMVEAGLRYSSRLVSTEINYFYAQAENLFFNVPTVVNGAIVNRQAFRNTRANGVEAQIGLHPTSQWSVDFSGTYQSPKFYNTPLAQGIDSATGKTVYVDINGHLPVRTPKVYYQFRTSYDDIATPLGKLSLHTSVSVSGKRYADEANTAVLKQYALLNAGFDLTAANGIYVRGEVRNILQSNGLTEGDPRAGETLVGATNTFNARVVDPRTFVLKIGYHF